MRSLPPSPVCRTGTLNIEQHVNATVLPDEGAGGGPRQGGLPLMDEPMGVA